MSYIKGDGNIYLPEHKQEMPPEPNPFTDEELALGLKALTAYKRAFGGIMLPDDIHWMGMKSDEKRRYIRLAQEMSK